MIYEVVNKLSGAKIYEYSADSPIEWDGMNFTEFDHNVVIVESTSMVAPKIWTPHEFRRLFTTQEQENILVASKSNISLENYLKDLELAPFVRSDDPMVVNALPQFEALGLIGAGRAQEILNG